MQRSPGGPRRRSWPCSCCRSSRSATSSHCSRCSLSRWASPSRTSTGGRVDPLEAQLQRQLEQSRDFFWHRLRWKAVSGFLEDMDVVTLLDVLEHQRDDSGFLAGLLGRMRPDTPLILTVPALPGLWSAWDVALGHHRRYRRGALRGLISSAGGVADEVSYLFPELVPAALVRGTRQPADRVATEAVEEFQFPDLPRWLNDLLYAIGTATQASRRGWPFGTSLLAVVRRAEEHTSELQS